MSERSSSYPDGLQKYARLPVQSPQRAIELLADQLMDAIDRREIRIADFSQIWADQSEIVVRVALHKPDDSVS